MTRFLATRVISLVITAFLAVTGIFLTLRVLPGDPTLTLLGESYTQEARENLRQQLGLNQPLPVQYMQYVSGLVTGDLGKSLLSNEPVGPVILRNFWFTLVLVVVGQTLALLIGIPAGVLAATGRHTWRDQFIRLFILIGISAPNFVKGFVLILLFVVLFPIFPLTGGGDLGNPISMLYYAVLPALTFAIGESVILSRLTRASVLDTLGRDYVRTARAKGLSESRVVYGHALRSSLIPIVTVFGLTIARGLAGATVIETVFSRPGLGSLFIQAVTARDYPLVQTTLAFFALLIVLANGIVDVAYGYVDPRIRFSTRNNS